MIILAARFMSCVRFPIIHYFLTFHLEWLDATISVCITAQIPSKYSTCLLANSRTNSHRAWVGCFKNVHLCCSILLSCYQSSKHFTRCVKEALKVSVLYLDFHSSTRRSTTTTSTTATSILHDDGGPGNPGRVLEISYFRLMTHF